MKTPSVVSLFAASFSGKVIYAIGSLAALPIATNILGTESVGLIGFFSSVLMILLVLEGGLTSSMIHHLASATSSLKRERSDHASISTYLTVFFIIGLSITLIFVSTSDLLASHWLNVQELDENQVSQSMQYMAIIIGLNLPTMLLQGVFLGKELQREMNIAYIPYSIMRTVGILVPIYYIVSFRNIETYFFLLLCVQVSYLLTLLYILYSKLNYMPWRERLRFKYIKKGMSFSRGVLLISITSVFIVQFDKIYLSGKITLEEFAFYSLASTFAGVPYVFSSSFNSVLFPRFSYGISLGQSFSVERLFRASLCIITICMSVICSYVYFIGFMPLKELFEDDVAEEIFTLMPILLMGTSIQSLLIVPFALQLAEKWTSFALRFNIVSIPFLAVLIPSLVNSYGASGASYAWLTYNVFSMFITFYVVCRRFEYLTEAVKSCITIGVLMTVVSVITFKFIVMLGVTNINLYSSYALQGLVIVSLLFCGVYFSRKHLDAFR